MYLHKYLAKVNKQRELSAKSSFFHGKYFSILQNSKENELPLEIPLENNDNGYIRKKKTKYNFYL